MQTELLAQVNAYLGVALALFGAVIIAPDATIHFFQNQAHNG
jgi:hypothetical protein